MESPFNSEALQGKVALITGGGSGIGFEIATHFGKHGAKIAIIGRRKSVLDEAVEKLSSQSIQALAIEGDVRKEEDAKRALDSTVAKFGKLDILVNGAAGNFLCLAEDLSVNAFRTGRRFFFLFFLFLFFCFISSNTEKKNAVLEIDTVGTYNMSHHAMHYLKSGAPGKKSGEGGLIINITATLQFSAAWFQTHLVSAKAAIDSMTRNLALEWGKDYNIRVNAIAPGPIKDTPGMSKLAPDEINIRDSPPWGEKWDIAMTAIFLASSAGKYVNGAIIPVDGGAWFHRPPHFPKETIRSLSRVVEKRSRVGSNTKSKL
ncbi:peroxisomal 2,4-dienoyl-CoA reductase isoform X1 [Selaginella moellendorffii]|uniref:peroxisomal 2,4-dienoyl-CoA reductase isoform X1 n=1 Tax=Selaginella moellendorffii TaxID=88036 RepID=UPI000D1C2738|nr:peroxisomal 2,4-dienoyl-CoA reductase isoform X1 [Selaginella moellendorffii]|eukprot:XP_024514984.1 peroxisomal 2,4-dienoyl-CoA reductase isoform X1 [Selaginella moellendorffii]